MFPWLFLWSPQVRFPWSGAVEQSISPAAFFGSITAPYGNGAIEQAVFSGVASYGRQLGILSEIVLWLAGSAQGNEETGKAALLQLESISQDISRIKAAHKGASAGAARRALRALQQEDPRTCAALCAEFGQAK